MSPPWTWYVVLRKLRLACLLCLCYVLCRFVIFDVYDKHKDTGVNTLLVRSAAFVSCAFVCTACDDGSLSHLQLACV